MYTKSVKTPGYFSLVLQKLQDYILLFKFRLSFTVVFSSLIAYALATFGSIYLENLMFLFLGGFLVTASANAFNQVLEKDQDKLMKRTMNRPLPAGRMGIPEAVLIAGLTGALGILVLWYFFNPISALLGALSLFMYSFVYTPLKRISSLAVLVGAFPGAMPPLIGWVSATGSIGLEAMTLFCIQFLWQFPHFWAIAWVSFEDYSKAGFKLLPSVEGQDKYTALLSIIYIIVLIPVSLVPVKMGMVSGFAGIIVLACGLLFLLQAIKLFRSCEMKDAKKLMIGSIIYLPVVLIALLTGRIF